MTVSCPCGATWTDRVDVHCHHCHQTFADGALYAAHRYGAFPDGRRCLTVAAMTGLGWVVRRTRHGVTLVWHEAPGENPPPAARENESEGLPAPDGTIHTTGIPTT